MRAILTYHSVDDSGSPISIDAESFRRHVRWLASGAVPVVSLEEITALPPDADAVALTFDDAYENFGAIAAPLLLASGLPATVFVVTGHVGGRNDWGGGNRPDVPSLPLLSWDALAELAEAGITIGAHGHTHSPLVQVSEEALQTEVAAPARLIAERVGQLPRAFAYPYGSMDRASMAAVRRGYAVGCTTELRVLRSADQPEQLPRLDTYYLRQPGRLERWGTAAFHRHLRLRACARAARRHLVTAWSRDSGV